MCGLMSILIMTTIAVIIILVCEVAVWKKLANLEREFELEAGSMLYHAPRTSHLLGRFSVVISASKPSIQLAD